MARKKFLRGDWMNYSKLGRKRKKKLKYRKAKGRHNKIRERMKGHPRKVSIGYKKSSKVKIKEIKIVSNTKELSRIKKGEGIILAKIGKKKKIEIARKSKELGIRILNLNIEKFLEKIEKEKIEKTAKFEKKEEKKEIKEKKKKEEKKQETKTEEKKETTEEKK